MRISQGVMTYTGMRHKAETNPTRQGQDTEHKFMK